MSIGQKPQCPKIFTDTFDDKRYNKVDDVEVLAYNVCLILLQGI